MSAGVAVTFSGRIASGKTSVTRTLAAALSWPRAGFSDYLRSVFAERGVSDPTREALQDLGQSLVTSDPDKFCRDVIAQAKFVPGGNLILDGIRHVDIQRRVVAIVRPSRTKLIHLAADDDVVAHRVLQRGASGEEFERANKHVVEQELWRSLPEIADLIIDGSSPLLSVVDQCLGAIQQWGLGQDVVAQARARAIDSLRE